MSDTTTMPLYAQQLNDVQEMQNQLLTFDKSDPNAARKAIQNVTVLRVYHQLARIVRFTEMLDKLEDRYYQSIDAKLDEYTPDDPDAWFVLIPIAERLQKMMVDSHKLLEPYLSMEQLTALEVSVPDQDPTTSFTSMILDQESREKVRTGIQQLMDVINTFDSTAQDTTDRPQVQAKAHEALAKLEESNSEDQDQDA